VRTFSIGFDERGYDESRYARAVAEHLGTDHQELRVTAAEAQAVLPKLPQVWDEPFADSSQIPTYLVNALARGEVTVALSGDGGDELFAGYNRHVLGARIWERTAHLPRLVRRGMAAALSSQMTGSIARAGFGGRVAGLAERLPKIAAVIGAETPSDVYARLVAQWGAGDNPVLGVTGATPDATTPAFADFRNAMLYLDTRTYLPDDILAKVDRAGMAVSLEGRIPFLDHRVIEFAWQVPLSAKIRDGRGKHILREVLYRYVPRALIDRPKAGFAIPVGDWLCGPLRPWAEALLDPARLRSQGYLDVGAISLTWARFRSGEKALLPRLWCVLMFQAWLLEQCCARLPDSCPD
jgi:asparagine synthase (glutamine-hydrolysing)